MQYSPSTPVASFLIVRASSHCMNRSKKQGQEGDPPLKLVTTLTGHVDGVTHATFATPKVC